MGAVCASAHCCGGNGADAQSTLRRRSGDVATPTLVNVVVRRTTEPCVVADAATVAADAAQVLPGSGHTPDTQRSGGSALRECHEPSSPHLPPIAPRTWLPDAPLHALPPVASATSAIGPAPSNGSTTSLRIRAPTGGAPADPRAVHAAAASSPAAGSRSPNTTLAAGGYSRHSSSLRSHLSVEERAGASSSGRAGERGSPRVAVPAGASLGTPRATGSRGHQPPVAPAPAPSLPPVIDEPPTDSGSALYGLTAAELAATTAASRALYSHLGARQQPPLPSLVPGGIRAAPKAGHTLGSGCSDDTPSSFSDGDSSMYPMPTPRSGRSCNSWVDHASGSSGSPNVRGREPLDDD